jgi:hypothetical protein
MMFSRPGRLVIVLFRTDRDARQIVGRRATLRDLASGCYASAVATSANELWILQSSHANRGMILFNACGSPCQVL